jgi:hypothetical protein
MPKDAFRLHEPVREKLWHGLSFIRRDHFVAYVGYARNTLNEGG